MLTQVPARTYTFKNRKLRIDRRRALDTQRMVWVEFWQRGSVDSALSASTLGSDYYLLRTCATIACPNGQFNASNPYSTEATL